jgi:hypothetical protein
LTNQEEPQSEGLPSAGPERVIFLRALQQFSDECEMPELQPECPFSVDLPSGGRGCGEECMDILAQFGDSHSRGGGVDLGNGIVARRRRQFRPRRGPEPGSRPFDAQAALARDQDSGRPIAAWSTVSLMKLLFDELSHSPVDAEAQRTANIESSWEELERRGHNVHGYVRWGRGRVIATSIEIATIFRDLEETRSSGEPAKPPRTLREAPLGWGDLLNRVGKHAPALEDALASMPEDERAKTRLVLRALTGPYAELTNAWVRTASRDDLLAWRPPSDPEEVLTLAAIETVTTEEQATFSWLVDRFTFTYLTDWAEKSLHREWRYLHAELVPPCSSMEMRQRRIAERDVSKAIASRVASLKRDQLSDDEVKPPKTPGLSINQLTSAAIEFLHAGRRSAAAALFEAAKRESANDPEVRNNYGFCILPDDPEAGLQEVHAAGELGFIPRGVTLANRMYGLFRLQRFASALEAAERLFHEEDAHHDAYLWDWRKGPENAKVICVTPHTYGVQFALDIAEVAGDAAQAAVWATRAESLGRAPEV